MNPVLHPIDLSLRTAPEVPQKGGDKLPPSKDGMGRIFSGSAVKTAKTFSINSPKIQQLAKNFGEFLSCTHKPILFALSALMISCGALITLGSFGFASPCGIGLSALGLVIMASIFCESVAECLYSEPESVGSNLSSIDDRDPESQISTTNKIDHEELRPSWRKPFNPPVSPLSDGSFKRSCSEILFFSDESDVSDEPVAQQIGDKTPVNTPVETDINPGVDDPEVDKQ